MPSDVFQCALDRDASITSESNSQPHGASSTETLLARDRAVHSDLAKSDLPHPPNQANDNQAIANAESGGSDSKPSAADPKEREIVRLQHLLTDLKTANKAQEVLLRSTRAELKNARDTLNTTFSEYCNLRDEMKMIKQKITKEHQAVIYRKDIELFALRKGNEQKEKYIKDHDAKLDEVYHQQMATVELKDAQLKMLKERLAALDRQRSRSPRLAHEHEQNEEGDHAVQVRMLRIRKGRASRSFESFEEGRSEPDEEKDATIASLREQLALAKKAAGEVVNQQGELQRAWDIVKKSQASLKAERELHGQTKERLQELAVKVEEDEQQRSRADSIARLPTIEEDKDELEAMFDHAQEDNLRLYTKIEALEKRLRDANARMFVAESEAEKLRVQVQQEMSTSDDLENVRPSFVHRAHFQRMEGQLKDSRDALAVKEHEVAVLKKTLREKIDVMVNVHAELDAAITFHTQDQDEIERLKGVIDELQTTKEQLMLDHERLAAQRTRHRIASADRTRDSARSSGTTLIHESSLPLTGPSDEIEPIEALPPMPLPTASERVGRSQEAPKTYERSASPPTLISSDVPPAEPRGLKRRSWGVRAYVKKMVGREASPEREDKPVPTLDAKEDDTMGRAALSTKDKNALLRPSTPARIAKPISPDPFITSATSVPVPQNIRSMNEQRHTLSSYATLPRNQASKTKAEGRPSSATGEQKGKDDLTTSLKRKTRGAHATKAKDEERPSTAAGESNSEDVSTRSSKRRSWGATNKLKRRSMF